MAVKSGDIVANFMEQSSSKEANQMIGCGQLVNKLPAIMETEISLLCSEELATCVCPKPEEFSPYCRIWLL
jgi:hypothetical protein